MCLSKTLVIRGRAGGSSPIRVVRVGRETNWVTSSSDCQTLLTDTGVIVLQWTRWVEHYEELLSHHSLTRLSMLKCRDVSTDHCLSHMTVGLTLLNMSAIISRWCCCILRMMHLCARCFLLISNLHFWDGLMGSGNGQSIGSRSWFRSLGLDSWLLVGCANPWMHHYPWRWEWEKPFEVMPIGIVSCIMKLREVIRRWPPIPSGWDFHRILSWDIH